MSAISLKAVSLSLALAVVLGVATVSSQPAQAAVSEDDIQSAMYLRGELGLPADRATVVGLAGTAKDVGSARHGIPLTATEEEAVDIDGRVAFADESSRSLMPWLTKQAVYGGAYLDQKDGGRLVIMLTKKDDAVVAGIKARMPNGKPGWRLEIVDYAWRELIAAVDGARAASRSVDANAEPTFVALDEQNNRVIVQYAPSKIDRMLSKQDELRNKLEVRVRVEEGKAPSNTASVCGNGNSRTNCWNPMPAGVRTFSGSLSNGYKSCTMGWHIYKAGASKPNQWLTAGHCVHPQVPGSNANKTVYHSPWYRGSPGQAVGVRQSTLYNTTHHFDIARISFNYPQDKTKRIYNMANAVVHGHPPFFYQGDVLKFSGATTNGIKTGKVQSTYVDWMSESWADDHNGTKLKVYGGWLISHDGSNPVSLPGDSGAPVFRQWWKSGVKQLTPIGIINDNKQATGTATFARLSSAFAAWPGWEVRGLAAP
jgi:hypothetical protein